MKSLSEPDLAQLRADIRSVIVERLDWFKRRYDIVSHHDFGPSNGRVYLGRKDSRVCRYCGLASPLVEFRKLAHAIPDQIGNNWLFDYEECDGCNEHFAKHVEDHFAKWTLPWRSMGRIEGKKGVPSLKSSDKQFRIDADRESSKEAFAEGKAKHSLKIYAGVSDARHEHDEATGTIKLTLERQPYIPMGVFKCLVKMAIAVMPSEEEKRCAHLKEWILLSRHTFESYPYKPLGIIHQFVPGPLPSDHLSYWLLRRKSEHAEDCLYMQFALQLGNHVFQVALPMHVEDRKQIETGTFQTSIWPNTWASVDHQILYGRSDHKQFDMSGTTQVRGEILPMIFSYEKFIGETENANRDGL